MAKKSKAGRKRVVFSLECPDADEVCVAGSFNDWDETAKVMKQTSPGIFEAVCMLPKGQYEYKFVVDEKWQIDPSNPNVRQNSFGTLNSIVAVD